MKNIGLNNIREEYLKFFEDKSHTRLKSYSLIPEKDKSLLLINAGMAPLKDYFMGNKVMPNNRATSSQRCIRTGDIENVGKTQRHATFFEMLGNFSFGDYFKKEAIEWSWEFLTKNMGMEKDRLFITVYDEDDEAYDIWTKEIGIPTNQIERRGKEDNFWELEEGPCGPCSEIHFDRGSKYDDTDDDRFMEIWNLVFTQFNKDKDGNYHPLDNPNIDTGMGLERIALIMEEAENIFEIKEFQPIMNKVENITQKRYGDDNQVDESIRVIMDHSKAMTFLIYDGVIPSNEGRGYVLRRLIRRAYRHGKLLGVEGNFLNSIIEVVMEVYSPEYPELKESKSRIFKIVEREEDQFQETIEQGLKILKDLIEDTKLKGEKLVKGKDAFKLYDTYGFPLDLTKEILLESGMTVDEDGFDLEMKKQREQSRQKRVVDSGWDEAVAIDLSKFKETKFIGYDNFSTISKVEGVFLNNQSNEVLNQGDKGIIILDKTVFYAESGGQVGDTGILYNNAFKAKVIDTQKSSNNVYYHYVEIEEGKVTLDSIITGEIDLKKRRDIVKNHSATHILHQSLREILGNHVNQAGSLVDDDKLRFDFTHFERVSPDELTEIEKLVNEKISEALDVKIANMSLEESKEKGAIGLFEDQYQDLVRVVDMGDFSTELCGGCHVSNTANIQMFKIISESGVAAGVRRIEAVTGRHVYDYLNTLEEENKSIANRLKVKRNQIISKIDELQDENKSLKAENDSLKDLEQNSLLEDLVKEFIEYKDINILVKQFKNTNMEDLRSISDKLKEKNNNLVVVFSSIIDDKLLFLTSVSKPLTKKGLHAGKIVKYTAQITGGNGGGRPDFASAGGKDLTKVDEALDKSIAFIKEQII